MDQARDSSLEQLIKELTMSSDGPKIRSIEELKGIIKKQQPHNIDFINGLISEFKPYLIVNEATSDYDTTETVETIQNVSNKFLSLQVGYLGNITERLAIKNSTKCIKELLPAIKTKPSGIMIAREIAYIIKNLDLIHS